MLDNPQTVKHAQRVIHRLIHTIHRWRDKVIHKAGWDAV
jgi:hypothetical protein